MALQELVVALTVFCLLSLVQGQFNAANKPEPECSDIEHQSGIFIKNHPINCFQYVVCTLDKRPITMNCPPTLFFDKITSNCIGAADAKCDSWKPPDGPFFPYSCSHLFYKKDEVRPGFVRQTCPLGQYFQPYMGVCTATFVPNDPSCVEIRGPVPTGSTFNCSTVADSDICKFRFRTNGVDSAPLSCAEGTEYSAKDCACIQSNMCKRQINSTGVRTQDPDCKASLKTTFSNVVNNVVPFYTEKSGSSDVRIETYLLSNGVEYSNGQANFASGTSGTQSFLYIPAYSNNQMVSHVIIEVVFRSASTSSAFTVINNSYGTSCTPSFEVNASYNGQQYSLSAMARGAGVLNVVDESLATGNVTGSIYAQPNEFIMVKFVYDGTLSLMLINMGATGTVQNGLPVTAGPTQFLGDRLAYTKCGISILKSFSGICKKIAVRDGCTNIAKGKVLL